VEINKPRLSGLSGVGVAGFSGVGGAGFSGAGAGTGAGGVGAAGLSGLPASTAVVFPTVALFSLFRPLDSSPCADAELPALALAAVLFPDPTVTESAALDCPKRHALSAHMMARNLIRFIMFNLVNVFLSARRPQGRHLIETS
jgi:hypothetical protein